MRDKENTQTRVSASWAYPFVKWNNETYVVTEEVVNETNIGKRIGEVTVYSDEEGTYEGNFSNIYKEGTEYYEISNINTKESIAIKNDKRTVYLKLLFLIKMKITRIWKKLLFLI